VGLREGPGERRRQAGRLGRGEGTVAGHPLRERLAGDQVHGEVGPPVVLAEGVDPDDVLVLEPARGLGLDGEALAGLRAGPAGDDLQGDLAPERLVASDPDDPHAAPGELAEEHERPDPRPGPEPAAAARPRPGRGGSRPLPPARRPGRGRRVRRAGRDVALRGRRRRRGPVARVLGPRRRRGPVARVLGRGLPGREEGRRVGRRRERRPAELGPGQLDDLPVGRVEPPGEARDEAGPLGAGARPLGPGRRDLLGGQVAALEDERDDPRLRVLVLRHAPPPPRRGVRRRLPLRPGRR